MSDDKKESPTPLFQMTGESAPRPTFGNPVIESAIEAIAVKSQAPDCIAMQTVLGALSVVTQGFANVQTRGGVAPISLFLLTIAASGERKSTCDGFASRALLDFQKQRLQKYLSDFLEFEARQLNSGNRSDVIDDDRNWTKTEPSSPINPTIQFSNLTMQALFCHFDGGNPSVGIFSTDAGQFFGGHAMRKENRLNTAADLSLLWDGARIDRHRVSSASQTYFGRRVTVNFMAQPDISMDLLSDPMLIDQGLLSRFLVAFPTSKIGTRTIDDDAAYQRACSKADVALDAFHSQISLLLETPLAASTENPLELEPRTLCLGKKARAKLTDFYNATEVGQLPDGPFAHLKGFTSKIIEQACRIAGVLTIFQDPDAREISNECMINAIEIAEWYLMEMCRLRDCGYVSPELRDAETLRIWLCTNRAGRAVTIRDLVRSGPRPAHNAQSAKKLIAVLEENGWVERLPQYSVVDGARSKLAWRVVA